VINNPSALSCKVGSHLILISTAHPWEVSCGALIIGCHVTNVAAVIKYFNLICITPDL